MRNLSPLQLLTQTLENGKVCSVPKPSDLLSTVEAAAILKVERSTISRWVASGRLTPAHQIGGRTGAFLFTRSDVEKVRDSLAEAAS